MEASRHQLAGRAFLGEDAHEWGRMAAYSRGAADDTGPGAPRRILSFPVYPGHDVEDDVARARLRSEGNQGPTTCASPIPVLCKLGTWVHRTP